MKKYIIQVLILFMLMLNMSWASDSCFVVSIIDSENESMVLNDTSMDVSLTIINGCDEWCQVSDHSPSLICSFEPSQASLFKYSKKQLYGLIYFSHLTQPLTHPPIV